MKTIAATIELIVRLVIFAAMLTVIAGQGRSDRTLAKVRVRAGR